MTGDPGAPAAAVQAALAELGLPYENPRPGAYLVKLEGQHKLATMAWLVVGAHSLGVEAFFCRQPDENHEAFYRFLLERNGRMYGVHFTLDPVGDVYLTGRLPLSAVSTADIDRLLGCVLSYSDENFDTALELGFGSAIRREWAWRVKRGESLANLRAFARFADPDRVDTGGIGSGPSYWIGRIRGKLTTVNRLGDLERAIMDVLWETDTSLTVREVSARLTGRNLAHTTVMTVLDRLAKKGFARRERDGRAWRYCPAATRETYVTELMLTALDQTGDRTAALTRFAQSVSGVEAEVLRDALEVIEGSGEGDDGT